jgi:hypothetical protein
MNTLSVPDYQGSLSLSSYSSDQHAVSRVIGHEGWLRRAVPVEEIRWRTAATAGAIRRWHLTNAGFGTFIEPIEGAEWWFVARPIGTLVPEIFNTTGLLLDENFDFNKSGKGLFAVEAILLQPGSTLYVSLFYFVEFY